MFGVLFRFVMILLTVSDAFGSLLFVLFGNQTEFTVGLVMLLLLLPPLVELLIGLVMLGEDELLVELLDLAAVDSLLLVGLRKISYGITETVGLFTAPPELAFTFTLFPVVFVPFLPASCILLLGLSFFRDFRLTLLTPKLIFELFPTSSHSTTKVLSLCKMGRVTIWITADRLVGRAEHSIVPKLVIFLQVREPISTWLAFITILAVLCWVHSAGSQNRVNTS